jgi:hypothetical protein
MDGMRKLSYTAARRHKSRLDLDDSKVEGGE